MDEPIRVLHVDDTAEFLEVTEPSLERYTDSFDAATATRATAPLATDRAEPPGGSGRDEQRLWQGFTEASVVGRPPV